MTQPPRPAGSHHKKKMDDDYEKLKRARDSLEVAEAEASARRKTVDTRHPDIRNADVRELRRLQWEVDKLEALKYK